MDLCFKLFVFLALVLFSPVGTAFAQEPSTFMNAAIGLIKEIDVGGVNLSMNKSSIEAELETRGYVVKMNRADQQVYEKPDNKEKPEFQVVIQYYQNHVDEELYPISIQYKQNFPVDDTNPVLDWKKTPPASEIYKHIDAFCALPEAVKASERDVLLFCDKSKPTITIRTPMDDHGNWYSFETDLSIGGHSRIRAKANQGGTR